MTDKKRALLYSRVSTYEQNISTQTKTLREYCTSRDWEVSYEIIEEGKSGGDSSREGFQQLKKLAFQKKVDIIVVNSLDRISRSLIDLISPLTELHNLNIPLVSIRESLDLSSQTGMMMAQLLSVFASYEHGLIKTRVREGLARAKAEGKVLGRPVTNDYKKIIELRNQGMTYKQIQEEVGCSKGAVWRALQTTPQTLPEIEVNNE
jgi:DNA invertase Pin-like site-specific DNA recombinase